MSENRAAKFFWHLQDIYQELKPCRFAFVVAIIGAIVFLGVEQGREVLRALDPDALPVAPRTATGAVRCGIGLWEHRDRYVPSRSSTPPPLTISDCKFLNINDCLGAVIGSDLRPRFPFYTQASCNMHHRAGLEEEWPFPHERIKGSHRSSDPNNSYAERAGTVRSFPLKIF